MREALVAAITSVLLASVADAAPAPVVHWVQFGPGGAAELRAVGSGNACPDAMIDAVSYRMAQRAAPDVNFPQPVCALTLPATARNASVGGA